MTETKECANRRCGAEFPRPKKMTPSDWSKKKYCSPVCRHGIQANERQDRIDEIRWISKSDHPESIAKRVGYAGVTEMVSAMERAGEFALARHLRAEHARYIQGHMDYAEDFA